MDKLTTLKNIGKEMERKLKSVGIHSKDDLIKIGSQEVFIKCIYTLFKVLLIT